MAAIQLSRWSVFWSMPWKNFSGPLFIGVKSPTKKLVSLRLSPDVIAHFKSTGPGWQSRIDETLRKVVKRKASA